jgi:hypothetical protein
MNQISMHIDKAEQKLKGERLEIENKMTRQIKDFEGKIQKVKDDVKAFETESNPRKADNNVAKIEEIKQTIKDMNKEKEQIHIQQVDLQMGQGEYSVLEDLKKDIEPYAQLWALQLEFSAKVNKAWKVESLSKQVPDDIEADWKKMNSAVMKLTQKFEGNTKLDKPK